jgi:hypothetical protein
MSAYQTSEQNSLLMSGDTVGLYIAQAIKNKWNFTFTLPIRLQDVVLKHNDKWTFIFITY